MDPAAVLQQQGMDLQQALTELELLRQDNAALLEALRLAQLGGSDQQGHLSKFNPDAAEQGIFTQDWELRYFVLSGTLLKYYTSERDVGRQYRGVLSLEDCIVEVEEPLNVKGPFIFDINDPKGDTLLRLSADRLETAKTWVKTLHAVGLRVRGYRRLTAVSLPGWQPSLPAAAAAAAAGGQQQQGLSRSFASLGRALSSKWSSPAHVPATPSMESELSIRRDPPPPPGLHHHRGDLHHPEAPAAAAAKQDGGSSTFETAAGAGLLPQASSVGPPAAAAAAATAQVPGVPANSSQDVLLLSDEDGSDVFLGESEDGSDPVQTTRLARLRQKCRWLKSELRHHSRRTRRRHTVDAAPAAAPAAAAAAAMAASAPASTDGRAAGGAAAAPEGENSNLAAAAAAAHGSGTNRGRGSRRHQRTFSAPIQKQVSWRWERLDVGDELPDADLSDSDHGSSSDASGSSTGSTQGAAGQQPASWYSQQPQLDPMHPVMQQQQQQLLDGGAGSAADSYLFSQQQQQQQPGYFSDHLEGIQEEDPPKRPQRISAFGEATEAAAIAAAGGVSAAGAPDTPPPSGGGGGVPAGVATGPPTPPPGVTSAGPSAAVRGSVGFKPAGMMGSIKPQGTGVVKPKRGPMVGYSPVHVSAKDSILTEADRHGVLRHEGFLNLGVVVLLASNIRMIIGNLLTYGLRLKVNRDLLQSVLPLPLSSDDLATLAAIPGSCLLFALGALAIEWLGLRLLQAQEKLLQGLQKKGVAPEEMSSKGAAISSRQERLLLLLNLLNAGGSLVLPCWLVLSNQSSLVPAFVLTVVAIVLSMKLATYAHCNTWLRTDARARAVAAAAANYPVPSTPLQPASFSSGTGSGLWSRARGYSHLATATTHTPATAACTAAGYDSGTADNVPPALRSSATDPHPFLMAGLRRTSSTLRRQAAAGVVVVRDVVYPANLVVTDLAYFLAAPTLTYQLNFPRLRQRRWRLLSRWLLLAVLTAIAMSFMQIQFLLPCMQSSLEPLREMNYLHFMERLLHLAVPNTAVWLAMFYLVFHLWLNILGEVLMFGDRMFYKEWWNAATLAEYWKLWNLPVHKWMLRTIFFPLVRRGAPRLASLLFVFFISAVMHEVAVGVPLRMLRGWAFWGMMLQVPLITATELLRKRLKADTLGNMVFWASFCVLGQPMCLVLYYHDFLLAKLGEQGWQAVAAQGEGAAARMSSGTFNSTLSTVAGSLVY